MTIYLYVKTHNITSLKYLGQTSSKNPHSYSGSGVYWKQHLKKHGSDYRTEILRECQTKEELKEWGLYYSELWNVVECDTWANLKIEQGDGGRQSEEVRKKMGEAGKGRVPWNKGKQIWDESDRKRISEQNKSRGPQSAETIAKRVSKNTGKVRSEESKQKMRAAKLNDPGLKERLALAAKISAEKRKADPEYKRKHSEKMKLWWAERKRKEGLVNGD